MMKTFESGSTILIALGLFLGGYIFGGSSITANDVEKQQDRIQTEYQVVRGYALELKSRYVQEREKCVKGGEWSDDAKCQTIREVDPKAQKLWDRIQKLDRELKAANSKTEQIQDHLEDINRMKKVVVKIAEAL